MHRAYVGIGSNLGDRVLNLERALAAIGAFGKFFGGRLSTRPLRGEIRPSHGFSTPSFYSKRNWSHAILLASLRVVEEELGRVRSSRWGARTMDLDLLLYDDREIDEPNLQVPHPHMHERAFVLVPLAEIDDRFETLRNALPAAELAGVAPLERESITSMPEERALSASAHVRALAQFLADGEVLRVRVQRADLDIEVAAKPHRSPERSGDRTPADSSIARIDTIKADLVGIFHAGRPVPVEGDVFEADRELGYIEALGIRTSIHSMGPGRLVSVAVRDGAAVEYGQPLFLVARGK